MSNNSTKENIMKKVARKAIRTVPNFEPGTVIIATSFVADRSGKLWWIQPETCTIQLIS